MGILNHQPSEGRMTLQELKDELDEYFNIDIHIIIEKILEINDKKTQVEALTNLRIEAVNLLGKFLSWDSGRDIMEYFTANIAFENKEYILHACQSYSKTILKLDDSITHIEKSSSLVNRYIGKNNKLRETPKPKVIDINKEFLNLFKSREIGDKVIDVLRLYDYIDTTQYWHGQDNKKNTQLIDVFRALDELKLLKKYRSFTKVATLFYNRFGLIVGKGTGGDITDRALRIEYKNTDIDVFIRLFEPLVS